MNAMPDSTPDVAEYSIDELAAHTRVPSRTIRFYQSKGALPKPEIRGRKAVYSESHVERLTTIAKLQARGLQIKAIRALMERIDAGELALEEWLGLEDQLHARWDDDGAVLFDRDAVDQLLGDRIALLPDLERLGHLQRHGDRWLAPSRTVVQTLVEMEAAGVDLEVADAAVGIARKHLARLADALGKHYVRAAGAGFGRTASPADLSAALDAARPLGQTMVRTVFGQEMERVLRAYAESGQIARLTRGTGGDAD
ncbi:MAG: DNA-binding transcriptional MerR regulator [Myxococcota bacterium]|jgi:DNA-binding transcriptional MerR regulator